MLNILEVEVTFYLDTLLAILFLEQYLHSFGIEDIFCYAVLC